MLKLNSYLVYDILRDEGFTIEAASSREAKAIACRRQGRKPSDTWTGLSTFTARKKY